MQQFSTLLSWRLFTTQHVSGVLPRPARPRTQHDCHHDTKVKSEAATAVIELLMMGGKMSETCWAVNKRQDNKLKNCCIWLAIYLNCTMMHGLTNLKFPWEFNPLNPELNPICYLLALLGAHHFLHVSRIRVKLLTFRRLMSYIYIYMTLVA